MAFGIFKDFFEKFKVLGTTRQNLQSISKNSSSSNRKNNKGPIKTRYLKNYK